MYRRRFDPTSALILWQVGVLGEPGARQGPCRPDRLCTLTAALRRSYPATHRVVLYYAATFPANPPVVQRLALARLPDARVSPLAMLYVPALPPRPINRAILEWYDEP